MDGVEQHPLDFEALAKGDVVAVEVIERAYQLTADMATYRTDAQLRLKAMIESMRDDLCVKCEGDGLRILTDEENAEYQDRRFRGHLGGARRSFVRQCRTDDENLSAESRERHSKRVAFNGLVLQTIEDVPKRLTATVPASLPAMR